MRVFVAINPSSEERARLDRAVRDLRESDFPIRWLPPENVHLTLKFLGDVADERVPELTEAIDGALTDVTAFGMALAGFGAFPSLRRPSVVWAGVKPSAELQAVQERVEAALEPLGFPGEKRPFRPHLTLGRAKKRASAGDFRGLGDLIEGLAYEDVFQVRSVDIMRSHLRSTGAEYEVLRRSELGR